MRQSEQSIPISKQSNLITVACCLLPVTCCLLPVACCLLPVTCCLLPVACYLLPVTCCLPSQVCFQQGARSQGPNFSFAIKHDSELNPLNYQSSDHLSWGVYFCHTIVLEQYENALMLLKRFWPLLQDLLNSIQDVPSGT